MNLIFSYLYRLFPISKKKLKVPIECKEISMLYAFLCISLRQNTNDGVVNNAGLDTVVAFHTFVLVDEYEEKCKKITLNSYNQKPRKNRNHEIRSFLIKVIKLKKIFKIGTF